MAIASIEEWIQGTKDYTEGIALFVKYSSNTFLKRNLAKGPTVFNVPKLSLELQLLSDNCQAPVDAPGNKKRFKVETKQQYDSLPDQVKAVKEEERAAFKEMSYLHSRLTQMEQEERKAADFRILALDRICRKLWAKLDYFEEHNKLPEDPVKEVKVTTAADALKRRNNLRTYISRNLESDKIVNWKAELIELENIINGTA